MTFQELIQKKRQREAEKKLQEAFGADISSIISSVATSYVATWLLMNQEKIRGPKGDTVIGPRGLQGDTVVGPPGPKPVVGIDFSIPKNGIDGVTPQKGMDYFDGEPGPKGDPGHTPTKEELRELFLADLNAWFKEQAARFKVPKQTVGSGDSITAGTGISITRSGGRKVISASGITLTEETPTGTVNGVNTTFTTTNTPLFVIIDGMMRVSGQGYTYSSPTITVDALTPPTQYIRSFYAV